MAQDFHGVHGPDTAAQRFAFADLLGRTNGIQLVVVIRRKQHSEFSRNLLHWLAAFLCASALRLDKIAVPQRGTLAGIPGSDAPFPAAISSGVNFLRLMFARLRFFCGFSVVIRPP